MQPIKQLNDTHNRQQAQQEEQGLNTTGSESNLVLDL